MAVNERVQWDCSDLPLGQLAPSQSDRQQAFPGNKNLIIDEVEWKEFRIPTGNAALDVNGPRKITRVRVVKLGRNIVCDDNVLPPVETGDVVTSVVQPGINGTSTLTGTETQPNPAKIERPTGYDWAEGG